MKSDEEMKKEVPENAPRNMYKTIYNIVAILFALVFLLAVGIFAYFAFIVGGVHKNDGVGEEATTTATEAGNSSETASSSPVSAYTFHDGSLYFLGDHVATGTPDKFELLGDGFAKDSAVVYLNGEVVSELDAGSFQVLSSSPLLVKDKSAVYFVKGQAGGDGYGLGEIKSTLKPLEGIDGDTFHIIDKKHDTPHYGEDKNGIYYFIEYDGFSINKLPESADRESLSLFPGVVSHPGETANSFLSKDANHVYMDSEVITGADPQSFSPLKLSLKNSSGIVWYSEYSHDNDSVFYLDEKVKGADPETLEMLARGVVWAAPLARDKNQVYDAGKPVASAEGLQVLPEHLERVDTSSMSIAFTNSEVVFLVSPSGPGRMRLIDLDHADAHTFRSVGESDGTRYWKDDHAVYGVGGNVYPSEESPADPETFQVLSDGTVKDKDHVYVEGK